MRIPWELLARLQSILAALAVALAAMMKLCAPPGALPDPPEDPPKLIEQSPADYALPVEQLRRVSPAVLEAAALEAAAISPDWPTIERLLEAETVRAEAREERRVVELELIDASVLLEQQAAVEDDWPVEQLRPVTPEAIEALEEAPRPHRCKH